MCGVYKDSALRKYSIYINWTGFFVYFRDLGEALRKLVAKEFPQGPISKVDDQALSVQYESFNRISRNVHRDKYPRRYKEGTVLNWPIEAYDSATTNEGFKLISQEFKDKEEE